MSDFKINSIASQKGLYGPTISGVSTVSSTGCMKVPDGKTFSRYVDGNEDIPRNGLKFYADAKYSYDATTSPSILYDIASGSEGQIDGATFSTDAGGVFTYDGSNDDITFYFVNDNHPFKIAYTLSIWIRFTGATYNSSSGRKDIVYGFGRPHLTINRESDGKIGMYVQKGGGNYNNPKTTTTSWTQNTWYNVTVTGDSGVVSGRFRDRIYVNGTLENSFSIEDQNFMSATSGTTTAGESGAGAYNGFMGNQVGFYLGSYGSGSYFPGQIGPLLIYDRELSSTEVTQVYDAYKSRFGY